MSSWLHATTKTPEWLHYYLTCSNPDSDTSYFHVSDIDAPTTYKLYFDTSAQRDYNVWYANGSIDTSTWTRATPSPIRGTGSSYQWIDDGSQTDPNPDDPALRLRNYKIEVSLPE